MHVEVITSHEELITIGGDRASSHKPEGEALSEFVGVGDVQLVMVMILNI